MKSKKLNKDKLLVLALIAEELRSIRLFQILETIGIEDSFFKPQLDKVIFCLMRLNLGDDKLMEFYVRITDIEAKRMRLSSSAVHKSSMTVYNQLCKKLFQ
jgi:hypothetical protein